MSKGLNDMPVATAAANTAWQEVRKMLEDININVNNKSQHLHRRFQTAESMLKASHVHHIKQQDYLEAIKEKVEETHRWIQKEGSKMDSRLDETNSRVLTLDRAMDSLRAGQGASEGFLSASSTATGGSSASTRDEGASPEHLEFRDECGLSERTEARREVGERGDGRGERRKMVAAKEGVGEGKKDGGPRRGKGGRT